MPQYYNAAGHPVDAPGPTTFTKDGLTPEQKAVRNELSAKMPMLGQAPFGNNYGIPSGGYATGGAYPQTAEATTPGRDYAKYDEIWAEHRKGLLSDLEFERSKAQREAMGKLGFAMSSGPGTSGLGVAAGNALDRQFAGIRARDLNRVDTMGTQFKLNWNLAEDSQSRAIELQTLQFKQQQALLQQQAELNSASWWEQLGGVVGFAAGQAVEWFKPPTVVYGGGSK